MSLHRAPPVTTAWVIIWLARLGGRTRTLRLFRRELLTAGEYFMVATPNGGVLKEGECGFFRGLWLRLGLAFEERAARSRDSRRRPPRGARAGSSPSPRTKGFLAAPEDSTSFECTFVLLQAFARWFSAQCSCECESAFECCALDPYTIITLST